MRTIWSDPNLRELQTRKSWRSDRLQTCFHTLFRKCTNFSVRSFQKFYSTSLSFRFFEKYLKMHYFFDQMPPKVLFYFTFVSILWKVLENVLVFRSKVLFYFAFVLGPLSGLKTLQITLLGRKTLQIHTLGKEKRVFGSSQCKQSSSPEGALSVTQSGLVSCCLHPSWFFAY